MKNIILVLQILISITLVSLILVQTSKGGLGRAFGGGGEYRTRRGAEQIIFRATIVCTALFFIVSVISLLIR